MERLKHVEEFTRELINEYVPHFHFFWTDRKQQLGVCEHGRRRIGLSKHYVQNYSDELVIDTILHEIAHALCGAGEGHGARWKAMCRQIGANPQRCKDIERVGHKWEMGCTNDACGSAPARYFRKPKYHERYYRCRKCGGGVKLTPA